MKMNKLFASVATAVVALGAVAPVATVSAASSKLPATTMSTDNPANKNSRSGSAQGTSTASVNVIDGFLSLDKVPDLAFGSAVSGSTAYLKDNSSLASQTNNNNYGTDGNNAGLLEITDSRHSDGASGNMGMGYVVKASLGQFAGDELATTDSAASQFTLSANTIQATDSKIYTADLTGANAITSNGGAGKTVVSVKSGVQQRGSDQFVFGLNHGIKMSIPEGVKAGAYTAPITWTLTSQPDPSTGAPQA